MKGWMPNMMISDGNRGRLSRGFMRNGFAAETRGRSLFCPPTLRLLAVCLLAAALLAAAAFLPIGPAARVWALPAESLTLYYEGKDGSDIEIITWDLSSLPGAPFQVFPEPIVYSGRDKMYRRLGVVISGVYIDDLLFYAERMTGIPFGTEDTRIEFLPTDNPYAVFTQGLVYSEVYGEPRYYYPSYLISGDFSERPFVKETPPVLAYRSWNERLEQDDQPYAIVNGYQDLQALTEELIASADTERTMRVFLGQKPYDDWEANLGYMGTYWVDRARVSPVYYNIAATGGEVVFSDGFAKGYEGEVIRFSAPSGMEAAGGSDLDLTRNGNEYSFRMPDRDVRLTLTALQPGSGAGGGGEEAEPSGAAPSGAAPTPTPTQSAAGDAGQGTSQTPAAQSTQPGQGDSDPWQNPFTDVKESDWFYGDARFAYERGLLSGVAADRFDPQGSLSRAMAVTILHRMDGSPAADPAGFSDAPPDQWYSVPIAWASAQGLTGGYGDGRFGTNDPVTREQLAAFLYRYARMKGYDVSAAGAAGAASVAAAAGASVVAADAADASAAASAGASADAAGAASAAGGVLSGFSDRDRISGFALEAMDYAVGRGILTGKGDGLLDPSGPASRAETVAILRRFLRL
jgi:hypothetical protein